MRISTLIFLVLTPLLAAVTGFVVWQVATHQTNQPSVSGTIIDFGVPGLRPEEAAGTFQAKAAVVLDHQTNTILFEQNSFERRSVASLTKLMTAMVALDHGIDWEHSTTIHLDEYVAGSRLLMHPGEEVSMRNLFHASLLGSANNATLAYVRELGLTQEEFVRAMNRKAIALGLEQTSFVEPTGLDPNNISTAYEIAKLAAYAFNQYPEIADATKQAEYTFTFNVSGREHTMRNPNKLITPESQPYYASKTGYIYEAGYCLVVQGRDDQEHLVAVLLGSPSEPRQFADIQRLLDMPTSQ